ncbi:ATP-binding protein [uncultured Sanguibacteroides sp.]|uniref:ATP-binding protein n=1 Tax=uncultured Sanguibacteroides sp. TaxID=1635151 RepID=UPI0025D31C51|nr:ATP-binding protein [uncultured Sanguibacteroides sp.]
MIFIMGIVSMNWFARKSIIVLYFFLQIAGGISTVAAKDVFAKEDYVLIINTYTESDPWSGVIIQRLAASLVLHDLPRVYTEHMNMLLIETEEELTDYKNHLFDQYKEKVPSAIVLLGNTAWGVFKDDIYAHWKDVPVLLCAEYEFVGPVTNYLEKKAVADHDKIPLAEDVKGRNVTVVYYPRYVKETISMMQHLLPDMEELLFISDQRYIGAETRKEVEQLVKNDFPDLKLRFLTEGKVSTDSLLVTLKDIDSHTGVLFLFWFVHSERLGEHFISVSLNLTLESFTSQPIFTLYDVGDGFTLTGGYVLPLNIVPDKLGQEMRAILTGQRVKRIENQDMYKPRPVLNYHNLQVKGITESLYPKNAFYYHKAESIWERYKYGILIIGLCVLCVLLVLLVRMRGKTIEINLLSKYQDLFEGMPIAFLQFQLLRDDKGTTYDGVVIDVNPRFEKEFKGKGSVVGKRVSGYGNFSCKEFIEICDYVLKKNSSLIYPHYYVESDKYYDTLVAPSKQKDILNIFMIDNTKLNKTQQQLRTTNHKLSVALEVANVIPWKWDLEKGTILCDINRATAPGGADVEQENISVPYTEYFSKICKEDRDKVWSAFQDLIKGKSDKVVEEYRILEHQDHHSKYEWVEAKATVDSWNEDGLPKTLVGSSLVITRRKEMELDLLTAKEKAEESNRLKSAFLANMSHEIRTPLNAIVGFSNILSFTENENEKREYVNIIESNNALLLQLIGDILDLSKIEAGSLEFVYSDINLNELLKEIETSSQLKANSKNLTVCFTEHLPQCHVNTVKSRLSQVLTNLITNAIKFTEVGGVQFGYRLLSDDFLYFFVTDTGCGIAEEKQKSVFKRFVKLNHFEQGSGLGLSICEMIVKTMGGDIGVSSEEGKGATFWFTIPYRIVEKFVDIKGKEYHMIPVEDDKLTLLIAEDNASNYKLFESILKKDYRIIHAWNGQEAVELFKSDKPHMVLMDINMPVMDGYEATAEIRKISEDIPIMAITAYAYASDEQRVMESGFDAYASKPINAQNLRQKIVELVKARMLFAF